MCWAQLWIADSAVMFFPQKCAQVILTLRSIQFSFPVKCRLVFKRHKWLCISTASMGKQAKERSYCHYISISSLAHYQIQNWIQIFSPYMQSLKTLSYQRPYTIIFVILSCYYRALCSKTACWLVFQQALKSPSPVDPAPKVDSGDRRIVSF